MAAAVNNIAATFSAARELPSSSSSPATAAAATISVHAATAPTLAISASWNPHSALRRSQRSNLLTLYGLPGPQPSAFVRAPPIAAPAISVGRRLPSTPLSYLDAAGAVRSVTLLDLSRGRTAVIVAVHAAFGPPRHRRSPGGISPEALVEREAEIRTAAAAAAVVAVNDVYVMQAWGELMGAAGAGVMMLSDPDAELAAALGVAVDLRGGAEGLGVRSEGYCMVAANGVVRAIFFDVGEGSRSSRPFAAARIDDVLRVL